MTALDALYTLGRAPAHRIAAEAGMKLLDVYLQLVAAEAHRLCRVEVTHTGKRVSAIEWVAL